MDSRKLLYSLMMLATLIAFGTIGYYYFEQMADLKNHFIICGFGRIGHIICQELFEDNIKFVVIEQNPAAIEELISLK